MLSRYLIFDAYSDCSSSYVYFNGNSSQAYYASYGKSATTGIRFKTLGVQVVCDDTGESRGFSLDSGIFYMRDASDGTYTYSVSIVDFNKAFSSGYFPKAKARYDSNRQVRFHLDSIMITTVNGDHQGEINSDGSTSYGTVYRDAYSIYNVHPDMASWGTIQSFNTYFDKEFVAWNGKAQVPDTKPYVRGMYNLVG